MRPSGIGECSHLTEVRLQCFGKTPAQAAACLIHDTDTLALERADG